MAEIQPISPTHNESYTGNIPFSVTIHFSARSPTNSSLMPYQDISCQYQLDYGYWNNASLSYASEQKVWYDPTFEGFWNQMDCNYNALLESLSKGKHHLNITFTPNLGYSYLVLSNGSTLIYQEENSQYNALVNSTIDFYVFGNYDNPASVPISQQLSFPITCVIIASTLTIVVIAVSILLFKRHLKVHAKIFGDFFVKKNSGKTAVGLLKTLLSKK
jgi:hypothetical protein